MPKAIENGLISLGIVLLALVIYTVVLRKPVERFAAKRAGAPIYTTQNSW